MADPNKGDKAPKELKANQDDEPTSDAVQSEGADLNLSQSRGSQMGDQTSSNPEKNNPGQHGRDGGTTSQSESDKDHNPAPSEAAVKGESPEQDSAE